MDKCKVIAIGKQTKGLFGGKKALKSPETTNTDAENGEPAE